ncbi:concanavalin A-like lectin/glucanase, partial [Saitoella complicata NRRL Y-17804]
MDRRRSSLALAALGLLATAAGTAQAACECGYQTGDGSVWSHAMTADFSSMADADTIADSGISSDWYAQTWGTDAGTAAYQMQNNGSNAYVRNGNLVVKTSGYSGSGAVQVGEVDTARTDILYGSFRSTFSVEATPGVCAGFFYYKSDTQETDIEVLTSESTNQIHYSNQPAYDASTDNSVPGATYTEAVSGGWTSSIQHRFDWQPSVTTFYQNGNAIRQMTVNVPSTPGAVIMNVWSDGGDWTQGPPTADAHMYISNYQFYFNVTNDQQGSSSTFEKSCAAAGGVGAVPYCLVDGAVTGKPTVASSTSTSSAASNISPDNSCGPSSAGNYTCPDNGCCSSHGWCG